MAIDPTVVKNLIEQVNANTEKFRKIMRAPHIMIKDKVTKDERIATPHEQLEEARKVLGRGYTEVQKYIVEQMEGGQLGKRNRRNRPAAPPVQNDQTDDTEDKTDQSDDMIVESEITAADDTDLNDVEFGEAVEEVEAELAGV